jgi:Putative prokaryotic signal transducing protein
MNNWSKIFTTKNLAEASIIHGLLNDNEVPVQILNKQDSSYPMFGDIEVYVPLHLQTTAEQLIAKCLLN